MQVVAPWTYVQVHPIQERMLVQVHTKNCTHKRGHMRIRLIPIHSRLFVPQPKKKKYSVLFCREILYTYIVSKDYTELPDMVLGINRTKPNKNNSTFISVLII